MALVENDTIKDFMEQPIYLDYQSTTPCDPRVLEAMMPYFTTHYGNAHSDHAMGQDANQAVEQARNQIANLLKVSDKEIIFTSGATEANNLAIRGAVHHLLKQNHTARRVITVATEHKSVLEVVHSLSEWGIETVFLPVGKDGRVDPESLRAALQVPTLLVSIMAANNETSTVQPIRELSNIAHKYGALFHCDMAQIIGKVEQLPFENIDLASLSGHKLYAPKGIGMLYVRRRPRVRVSPLFYGGFQERGIRSGTLSVPLIVGLGKACEILLAEGTAEIEILGQFKAQFIKGMQAVIPDLKTNGSIEHSLPGSLNLCIPNRRALDFLSKIPHLYLSTGSACSVSSLEPSYVLTAMGISKEDAQRSFRLSFGRMTTQAQVHQVIHAFSCAYTDNMAQR